MAYKCKMSLKDSIPEQIESLFQGKEKDTRLIDKCKSYLESVGIKTENPIRDIQLLLSAEMIARTPKGVTGYPLNNDNMLNIDNVIVELLSENLPYGAKEHLTDIANILQIDIINRFNPIVKDINVLTKTDYSQIARILSYAYIKHNMKSKEEKQKLYKELNIDETNIKPIDIRFIILNEFESLHNEYIPKKESDSDTPVILDPHKEHYYNLVVEELQKPNSELYEYFANYIKLTYGKDVKSSTFLEDSLNYNEIIESLDENSENNQVDNAEDISKNWDEIANEAIDRRKTLSSALKTELLKIMINSGNFVSNTPSKMYIPNVEDINTLWNNLIQIHINDFTKEKCLETLKAISTYWNKYTPIYEVFKDVVENKSEDEYLENFVNAYVQQLHLAQTPAEILQIKKQDDSIIMINQDSFAQEYWKQTIKSHIENNLKSHYKELDINIAPNGDVLVAKGFYDTPILSIGKTNLHSIKSTKNYTPQIIDAIIKKQITILNKLNLGIDTNTLRAYYDINGRTKTNVNRISNLLKNIIYNINDIKAGKATELDIHGYINVLANIASIDPETPINNSYLDVVGKQNYTPQFDSLITKTLSGFKTRYGLDKNALIDTFRDILNDPTMSNDSVLIYNAETGTGIFEKDSDGNWIVNNNAAKAIERGELLNLSRFDGLRINYSNFKYDELSGSKYAYCEIYTLLNGKYLFLTSDSPRSYAISIQPYTIDDLFDEESVTSNDFVYRAAINAESKIVKVISNIIASDINKFKLYAKSVFSRNLEDNKDFFDNIHKPKYWNGKKVFDANGIPTGRIFQFITLVNNNGQNYISYLADKFGITESQIYNSLKESVLANEGLIVKTKNITFNLEDYINEFAVNYIETILKDITSDYGDIINALKKNTIIHNQADVNALTLEKHTVRNTPTTIENYDIDSSVLSVLKAVLNNAIYGHSYNELFLGSLEEYKHAVDMNKRVNQIVRNGLNSANTSKSQKPRKILVIDDLNFGSNIISLMENEENGIKNKNIIDAYRYGITINDSQSLMTDKALEDLLRATGRWDENSDLVKYIKDLRDPNKPFNPATYTKLVEQLKLFGVARRKRNKFFTPTPDVFTEEEQELFGNEVDTVQIKDSTVVLFEASTRGSVLGDLYDWMIEKEVDQISPISAVKVSGITPLKIHNDNQSINFKTLESNLSSHILNMETGDFVIQQDIKADILDVDVIVGSQLIKHVMEGLVWDKPVYELNGKKLTGAEIFRELQTALVHKVQINTNRVLKRLGFGNNEKNEIVTDGVGNVILDKTKLLNVFREIIDQDVSEITIREALGREGIPNLPLSYPIIKNKLERILASILTKQINNIKLPGFHAPIRADIFTANGESYTAKELYSDKDDAKDKEKQENYSKVLEKLNEEGSITYRKDFLERCAKEKRSTVLRADYNDAEGFHYAEVLINPTQLEFFENIKAVKEVTLKNGSKKQIITVDIDKIDREGLQMLGIRIPTEGKQSTVVFEVVGYINTGATQAIFPQSLVKRTGWDFDIDTIYAYRKHLKFEQGKYTPIKIDLNKEAENRQRLENLEDSWNTLLLEDNFWNNEKTLGYINEKGKVISDVKIIYAIYKSYKTTLFNALQNISNAEDYIKQLDIFESNLKYISDIVTGDYVRNGKFDDESKLDVIKKISKHLTAAYKALNDVIKSIKDAGVGVQPPSLPAVTEILNNILEGRIVNPNNNKVLHYTVYQDFIESKKRIKEKLNKELDYKSVKDLFEDINDLKDYIRNIEKGNDNHILDCLISILSNKEHRDDVDKPNDFEELIKVSERINAYGGKDTKQLNPNNLKDKIVLNNMSMASRHLKGVSVNEDTFIAVMSTLNCRFAKPITRVLTFDSLPTPEGISVVENGKLTKEYEDFLDARLGKDNWKVVGINKLLIKDCYIGNDASNQHLDISCNKIENQQNQWTSAILDILKSGLGFNLNMQTLSLTRVLSMTPIMERSVFDRNMTDRFTFANLFIHQPIFVKATSRFEVASLNYSSANYKNIVKAIYSEYLNEFRDYFKIPKSEVLTIDKILKFIENSELNIDVNTLPQYLTSEDLKDGLENNDTDIENVIRQIFVYHMYKEYIEAADVVKSTQFILKTEGKVDSFYAADRKEYAIADYLYNTDDIKSNITSMYNKSAKNVKNKDVNIQKAFKVLSTKEFNELYPKDKVDITYLDYKQFIYELSHAHTSAERKHILDKYNIKYKTENKILTPENKDVIESIFSNINNSYIEDGKIVEVNNTSIYPIIETRYIAHWLMANAFGDVFATRSVNVKKLIYDFLKTNVGYLNDGLIKSFEMALINHYTSSKILPTKDIPADKYSTLVGAKRLNSDEQKVFDTNQAEIINKLQNKVDNYTDEDFKDFCKLTLANQIDFIKHNPILKDYINKTPIFQGKNVFKFVTFKAGDTHDILYINHESGANYTINDLITQSIDIMLDSEIPFISHTIRQLIVYTYLTKGFNFGYNISKYIPIDVFKLDRNNKILEELYDRINEPNLFENVKYFSRSLRSVEGLLTSFDSTTVAQELKPVFNQIVLAYPNIVCKVPSEKDSIEKHNNNSTSATITYFPITVNISTEKGISQETINGANVVNFKDENGKQVNIYLESEFRLLNSDYREAQYVNIEGVIYEKVLIHKSDVSNDGNSIYAYIPANGILGNEYFIKQNNNGKSIVYKNNKDTYKYIFGGKEFIINKEELIALLGSCLKSERNGFESISKYYREIIKISEKEIDLNISNDIEDSNSPTELNETVSEEYSNETFTSQEDIYSINLEQPQNVIKQPSTLIDAIEELKSKHDNNIYIKSPNDSSFESNLHKDVINVDLTKNPKQEAIRIIKDLKGDSFYINGSSLINSGLSLSEINSWTKDFIANIEFCYPSINKLSTILNDGVGYTVSTSHINGEINTFDIFDNSDDIYSIVIERSSLERDNPVQYAYFTNGQIAVDIISKFRGLEHILASSQNVTSNYINDFASTTYMLKNTEDLINSLKAGDTDSILTAYSHLIKVCKTLEEVINELYNIVDNIDFESVRNNYAVALEYRDILNTLRKLTGVFSIYDNLQIINIEDTELNPDNEEDVVKFEELYSTINKRVETIKDIQSKINEIDNKVCTKIRDALTWRVLDRSRNPNLVTAFGKLKSFIANKNYNIENIDNTTLSITQDEWKQLQDVLFAFRNDITNTQLYLDSAFVTGIPILDIQSKAYDTAKDDASRKARAAKIKLEDLLDKLDPRLNKDASARIELMHKLIDDRGDLIGEVDKSKFNSYRNQLYNQFDYIIKNNLENEDGSINNASITLTLTKLKNIINTFNKNHDIKIVELSSDEINEFTYDIKDKTNVQIKRYKDNHNIVELIWVESDGTVNTKLFKFDTSLATKSKAYSELTEKEKEFLKSLKELIQDVIMDYNPDWINYFGAQESVMPYLPIPTFKNAAKTVFSLPKTRQASEYTDLDNVVHIYRDNISLTIPKKYHKFDIPKKYTIEDKKDYEARVLKEFKEWYDKYNKLEYKFDTIKTIADIKNYNQVVLNANKEFKAKTMEYDIVAVMDYFAEESYSLKAIKDFNIDYELTKYIADKEGARQRIPKAMQQYDRIEKLVNNTPKYNDFLDVAAGTLLRFSSISFMWFNFEAGFSNIFKGITDMITYATNDGFVSNKILLKNIKDVLLASKKYLADINSNKTDDLTVAIIRDFDNVYQDTSERGSSLTGRGFLIKALNYMNTMGYAPNSMGEFVMQYGMLLAATESHKVINGKIVSFQDFYNDSLESILKQNLTTEQYNEYTIWKQKLSDKLKNNKNNKVWTNNFASEWLRRNRKTLNDIQRKAIFDDIKKNKSIVKTEFDKLPTFKSLMSIKDGQLYIDKSANITNDELADFRSRVKAINQSLHGIYDITNRNYLQDYALGDLFMQFRKWMRPTFVRTCGRRFGEMFYNEQLGALEVPVFTPMFDLWKVGREAYKETKGYNKGLAITVSAIGNLLKAQADMILNAKYHYNSLSLEEQIAYKQNAKTAAAIAFAALAVVASTAFADDDDDDNKAIEIATYYSTRYFQQMFEIVPVVGWANTLGQFSENIFAGQKLLTNAWDLTTLVCRGLWIDPERMVYDRGVYKGADKRLIKFMTIMPIGRQFKKYVYRKATMSYYDMYSPIDNIMEDWGLLEE